MAAGFVHASLEWPVRATVVVPRPFLVLAFLGFEQDAEIMLLGFDPVLKEDELLRMRMQMPLRRTPLRRAQ